MAPTWQNYPNGVLFSPSTSNPNYDEPIQGGAPNCSCIAGMSSLAWVYPQMIKQKLSLAQVIFPGGGTVAQDSQIYMNGANFIYTSDLFSPAPSYEIWPSLYEKGYAKLIQGTPPGAQPDMTTGNWNNFSLTPLSNMTGWMQDVTNIAPGMDVATKLAAYCDWDGYNSAQTKYPGIAWTAAAAGTNPAGQIYQNHSYSILGLYNDGNTKWVILRDPKRAGAPGGALNIAGGWPVYYGTYYRGGNKINPSTIHVPLTNGTFGITVNTFSNLFAGFGFVR